MSDLVTTLIAAADELDDELNRLGNFIREVDERVSVLERDEATTVDLTEFERRLAGVETFAQGFGYVPPGDPPVTTDPDPDPGEDPVDPTEPPVTIPDGVHEGTSEQASGFLWKPVSESDGNAVALLPTVLQPPVVVWVELRVSDFGRVIAPARYAGNTHNGGRMHYRFPGPGAAAPMGCVLVAERIDGSEWHWYIGKPDGRIENRKPTIWPKAAIDAVMDGIDVGGGPGPSPDDDTSDDVLPITFGGWEETQGALDDRGFGQPSIRFAMHGRGRWAETHYGFAIHELYDRGKPWLNFKTGLSGASMGDLAKYIKDEGWHSANIDPEGPSWHKPGYLPNLVNTLYEAEVMVGLAPKASLELSGRYPVRPGANGERFQSWEQTFNWIESMPFAYYMYWAYGNHLTHVGAYNRYYAHPNNKRRQVLLCHDTHRGQAQSHRDKGYIGYWEGPKLVQWCAEHSVPYIEFYPLHTSPESWANMRAQFARHGVR